MIVRDGAKINPCHYLTLNSIRGEPDFENVSAQMLRVLDTITGTKNYEARAMNEFRYNPEKYPLLEVMR